MWGFFSFLSLPPVRGVGGGWYPLLAEKFRTEENKGAEVMNRLLRGAAAGLNFTPL
jgi:hypothetical protein